MKVGFLHIPKCAGTSLSSALYAAFGMRKLHISALRRPGDDPKPHSIERKSMAYRLARNVAFLSGHLTFSEMKSLDRNFIFTTLREPKMRFFSLFTYAQSRAHNPRIVARKPSLEAAKGQTFAGFAANLRPNGITRLLLKDVPGLHRLDHMPQTRAKEVTENPEMIAAIDAALARFDMILAGSQSEIAAHLGPLTPAGEVTVALLNESRVDLPLDIGCSEAEFAALLEGQTWLDSFLFERAARLFPDHISTSPQSLEAAVAALKDRYRLRFS